MKKVKILIRSNDKFITEKLSSCLSENERIELVAIIEDVIQLDKAIESYAPDVLFLDIQLTGSEGLQILKNINSPIHDLSVVLITEQQQNINMVVNLPVFYCLFKPFNRSDIIHLIEKLDLHLNAQKRDLEKIKLQIKNGYVYLNYDEILMLEAEGNYTRIVTTASNEYVSSYNMGRLHKKLNPDHFFRINRGCIINAAFLRKIDKKQNMGTITVDGKNKEISISNAFVAKFNKLHR